MKALNPIWRLIKINRTLTYYRLDNLLLANSKYRWISWLNRLILPWNWRPTSKQTSAVRLRLALEELGPIFIKFGQALSTRKDLLPEDFSVELTKLQDDCPPFDEQQAKNLIETALKQPIDQSFASFEIEPMASASIAQVHAAKLPTGEDVVVKVVRPDIKPVIQQDVKILFTIANWIEKLIKESRRLHPVEVVAEFEKTLFDEMNMMREAANATQLRRNFEGSDLLYVPEVYWSHTSSNVMTMERIYGIRISETDKLIEAGIDLTDLSAKGVTIFFTQVFKHNFFHADMHPGNIFVLPDGRYAAIDFGIMGTLTPEDQRYLAENFLAFFNRDYLRVSELHIQSEWVPKDTRVNELESAIRAVCEPIWDRPLKEISFGLFLMRLFQTARRFGMEVQPQLVLLQKTLLNIEGLGRQLDDQLDLWDTAKPFLEDWMKQRVGLKSLLKNTKRNLPFWIENAPKLPGLLHASLEKISSGKLDLNSNQVEQLTNAINNQSRQQRNRAIGLLLLALAGVLSLVDYQRLIDIQNWDNWLTPGLVLAAIYLIIKK